ncbi:MAG: class I SAM-dependent methyltransferase [Clostridia bacterium]|nr:class I SAM-dependent methyltransferase [Clostridia bacterium]
MMDSVGKEIYNVYEKIAEAYDSALWNDMPYNNQINFFLSLLNGKKILDIGCGIGSFTKYVADKGYSIDGIDFSPKMIEIASKKVNNANFYIMDMTNITLTKKYDGLMIINSTIHIEKKYMKKTFQYFKKLLNDNGIIFVILQEGNGEHYIEEPLDTSIKEFVNFYQESEIKSVFEQCNLEIIKMERIKDYSEFELGNNQLAFYLKEK